jgi:uncharacterized protein (TIGR03083 family)
MEPVALLTTVPTSTDVLLSAARAAGLATTIPTCVGWRTHDLISHVAGVFRWVTSVVEAGGPTDRADIAPTPEGEAAFGELEAASRAVVAAIAAIGPDGDAWNWAGEPPTGAFWHRRMAHEAAIHAADAQVAAGQIPAIEPGLAADGIDELLTVLVPRFASFGRSAGFGTIGTLHVHCTDTEGEWLVEPAEGSVTVRREHAKGDAALRGDASDLLLRLYNRGDGGEVIGDTGVLDRWRATVQF